MTVKTMTVKTAGQPSPQSTLAEGLSQNKIPSLDGLRAVAVLLVICYHLNVPFVPDGRGVLTFFVLSGFLITWIMLKESEKYGDVSIRNFYVRRVLRIFPAFYVFLILQFAAQLITRGNPSTSAITDYLSSFSYISNYRIALTPQLDHSLRHTWALSVEEQFYLLWPCFFVAFQKDLRRLTYLLIAIIAAVDVYRMVLFFNLHVNEKWLTFAFDCRMDHLLVGCLLAVLLKRGALTRFWTFLTARTWLSIIPFGLIILSIALRFHYQLAYKYVVGFVVDPLLTALFLVQVIAMSTTWLWGWLNWRVIRYLGQISYAMFLYHMLANKLVIYLFGQHSLWFHLPAVVMVSALLGAASFHLVERRFLRLKSRFTKRPAEVQVPATVPSFQPAST